MHKFTAPLLGCLGLFALASAPALAQDAGALLDLLVRKGVIADQEAENLRSELVKDFAANTAAGKLDLPGRVSRLALAGDVRLRYQYDNEVANNFGAAPSTGRNHDRSRYRYRLRFGPTVTFAQNWHAGFRLETAAGASSTNDDFGAAGSTNFAKDGNTPFVGQAWIQYSATRKFGIDRLDLRAGKYAHPFFTPGVNGFWLDSDLNPEGFSQELVFTGVGGDRRSLAVRGGQYLLAANARTTDRLGRFLNTPASLWIGQVEWSESTLREGTPCGWRLAPSLVVFAGPEVAGTTLNQADSATTSNYDHLAIALLPMEYTGRLAGRPLTVYATYGYNFRGWQRADWLYSSSGTSTPQPTTPAGRPAAVAQMANAGLRLGGSRNPGDLQFTAEYRYVEPGAYTQVLLDSDFNGGRINGRGFILSLGCQWTEAIGSTVAFFHSENIDKNSAGTVGFHRADVLQVDLSARF